MLPIEHHDDSQIKKKRSLKNEMKKKCLDYLIPGSSQFVILLMEIKLGAQSRFKYIEMRIGKERIYILYWKRLHFLT